MKVRYIFLLSLTVMTGFFCGCGDSSSESGFSPGSTSSLSGAWAGNYTTSIIITASSMSMVLTQTNSAVSGTFQLRDGTGTVSGTVFSSSFSMTLNQVTASCTGTYSSTGTASGSSMSLSFSGLDLCQGAHTNGSASLTKS